MLETRVTQSRWMDLMNSLDLPPSIDTFDRLVEQYSEPHRYYHTVQHLEDCLALLDEFKPQISRPGEVELALWFHDAIYNTRKTDNEEKSADRAGQFLRDASATDDLITTVCTHILATKHHGDVSLPGSQWVVDIDLAVLGQAPAIYDSYAENIRREYAWVPGFVFRKKRRSILQSFLERDSIYLTGHFRTRYEHQARENIRRELAVLA